MLSGRGSSSRPGPTRQTLPPTALLLPLLAGLFRRHDAAGRQDVSIHGSVLAFQFHGTVLLRLEILVLSWDKDVAKVVQGPKNHLVATVSLSATIVADSDIFFGRYQRQGSAVVGMGGAVRPLRRRAESQSIPHAKVERHLGRRLGETDLSIQGGRRRLAARTRRFTVASSHSGSVQFHGTLLLRLEILVLCVCDIANQSQTFT